MEQNKKPNIDGIHVLLSIFLHFKEYNNPSDAAAIIKQLITQLEGSLIVQNVNMNVRASYHLPYDKIADYIFENSFNQNLEEVEYFIETVDLILLEELNPDSSILICYRKFTRHLSLALRQKIFMEQVSLKAAQVANEAQNTATKAQKAATEANKLAQDTLVNYITILGVFASIIITVFGGIQLIQNATQLLGSKVSLSTVIITISFIMLCLISTLLVLISWINQLKNPFPDEKNFIKKYGIIFSSFIFFIFVISAMLIYKAIK